MKSRAQRLEPVLELARQRARKGAQAVVYMQHKLEQEQGRLEQLMLCKEEYNPNSENLKNQTHSSFNLKSLQQFKANLEIAIGQQSRQVELVKSQLQEVRGKWQQLDARSKGIEKTQVKLQSLERAISDKKEQKELEEHSAQRAHRQVGQVH